MGNFNIKNMQLQSGRRRQLAAAAEAAADVDHLDDSHVPERFRGRELGVPLSQSSAGYEDVGTWAPGLASPTVTGVIFPGNTREVPSDTVDEDPEFPWALVWAPLLALTVVGGAIYVYQGHKQRKRLAAQKKQTEKHRRSAVEAQAERDAAKKELEAFKEAMTGVRAAIREFDPRREASSSSPNGGKAVKPSVLSAITDTSSTSGASLAFSAAATEEAAATKAAAAAAAEEAAATKGKTWQRVWATYYWMEDAGRVDGHDPKQVLKQDGKNWVRYANAMSRHVEDEYAKWLLLPAGQRAAKAQVPLDLSGQISSTGTEEKAYAKESGTKFNIDFQRMVQINVKTKYERPVLREQGPVNEEQLAQQMGVLSHELMLDRTAEPFSNVISAMGKLGLQTAAFPQPLAHDLAVQACLDLIGLDSPPDEEAVGGGGHASLLSSAAAAIGLGRPSSPKQGPVQFWHRMGDTVGAVTSMFSTPASSAREHHAVIDLSSVPEELRDEDMLLLYPGQLLQTSKTRNDGWAFGSIMLDTVEGRPNPGIAGLSTQAGWFPLANTAHANADQLQKLQKTMGDNAAGALAPPKHWKQVADPMQAELTLLPEGQEKAQVVTAFMKTLPPGVRVVDVQRIQNVSMWQSYAVKRQTVRAREKDASKASRFERVWLFHGTDEDTVPKIVQQGFNRAFCGKNATAFGKGVYFARDAAYSSSTTYSRPNAQRIQHMFLCRVVVGEYCKGVRDALTPAVRTGLTLFDSTVNQMDNPSIYVTYHDAQAYPEYIVRFSQ